MDDDSDFDDEEAKTIQLNLLKMSLQQKDDDRHTTKLTLNRVLNSIGEYLHQMHGYKVIGGRAVNAWLNPQHLKLSFEELEMVKSIDWDIVVLGDDGVAKGFFKKLAGYLSTKLKTQFDIRSTLTTREGYRIFQLGIPEGSDHTEWICDVHGELKLGDTITISNIVYPNLKSLLEDIQQALEQIPDKLTKRWTRMELLKRAMNDIRDFNTEIYNKICSECKRGGVEHITGFDLKCDDLEKMCE